MTPRIVQRIEIDAGHRLLRHEGKCRNIHGHRYVFEIVMMAPRLDSVGRVIDFGEVKRTLGGWLEKHWDHGFIAQVGDPIIRFLQRDGSKVYVIDTPPTAENLSALFLSIARGLLPDGVDVKEVRLWETPNCRAEAQRDS